MDRLELGLHLPQRDERQHRLGVLVRTERAVGPELVGGGKQSPRKGCDYRRLVVTGPQDPSGPWGHQIYPRVHAGHVIAS